MIFSKFSPSSNKLKNTANGECYILGNGPSLKQIIQQKDFFKHTRVFFSVNDFVLSNEFILFKPAYYVIADPGYWTAHTFEKMKELREEVFRELNAKTNWKITLLAPYEASKGKFLEKRITSPHIEILYFNTTPVNGTDMLTYFYYDRNLSIPRLQNVLVGATYLALHAGFSKINLLGADHSWLGDLLVNQKNEVCLVNKHFYDNKENNSTVWLKASGEPYKIHEVLSDLSKMFEGYHFLAAYAGYKNAEIINLTQGSFIDAFKRSQVPEL